MKQEKRPFLPEEEVSSRPILGEPVDVWEQINKYGTYEVQDTTDTDNVFPTIGYEGSEPAYTDGARKVVKKNPEP